MKTKTIKKNILIFGLGISGMSFANYLKDKVNNLYCWDDQLRIRNKGIRSGLQIKSINNLKFQYLDYLVLSPSINHRLKHLMKLYQKLLKKK